MAGFQVIPEVVWISRCSLRISSWLVKVGWRRQGCCSRCRGHVPKLLRSNSLSEQLGPACASNAQATETLSASGWLVGHFSL